MPRFINEYLRERFGCKVYKLALDGGMTCPNRDGLLDTRGCIFCSKSGSGEFAQDCLLPVNMQIELAKERVADKINHGKYIAYFQNHTNTYAGVEYLSSLFYEAIKHPDIAALSVATRPDCLPLDVLELLSELNHIKPVWVELGLQTIHERTARYIRRCFSLDAYDKAVSDLKCRGIEVIVHMIIGLPGESHNDIVRTAKYISDSGADGIKLQLLHILRGTDIADAYYSGKVKVLSLDEYTDVLSECIDVLRSDIVIHRLTGDGAKRDLIAPLWSADKKKVLAEINRKIKHD